MLQRDTLDILHEDRLPAVHFYQVHDLDDGIILEQAQKSCLIPNPGQEHPRVCLTLQDLQRHIAAKASVGGHAAEVHRAEGPGANSLDELQASHDRVHSTHAATRYPARPVQSLDYASIACIDNVAAVNPSCARATL